MFKNWAGDARVARHMFWQPFESEADVRAALTEWENDYQNDDYYRWAIVEKAGGQVIGSIGLANFGLDQKERWEPAYNIGHSFWGQGYTGEALAAVVDYFWDTGAPALYAAHATENPASGRVLEKAGFVFRHRDAYQKPDGTLVPAHYYRLKRPAQRHVGTRPVQTPRLLLRRLTPDDAEAMYHTWASDDEVTRYLRWDTHQNVAESRAILQGWLADYRRPETYLWGIELRETGALIGSIGIIPFDEEPGKDDYWQPGYCIGRAYWGQGYTSEALLAVMDYFVRCTGIEKLYCCHAVGNPASARVMEKAGFVYDHDGVFCTFAGRAMPAKYYVYQPKTQ